MTQNQQTEHNSDTQYLNWLSKLFPTIAAACTEIINLEAILHLPKGTEHFLADIHGENEAFQHVLKNASGNIKRKVNELFGNSLRESEKKELCTLIYYPEQKIELIKASEPELEDWYHITIHQLVKVCRDVSSKYTRSKVRKSLPPDFSYIIEELLHEHTDDTNKTAYVNVIVDTIITTGRVDDFIIALCNVIQRLAIDQLHILGDIYDRNVLRLSLRYANLATLEEGYGINLVPLATFAMDTYGNDPCEEFMPKVTNGATFDGKTIKLIAQMHKAISIIQFKVEAQIFLRNPEWRMSGRNLLSCIDRQRGVCIIDGKEYEMKSNNFPTVDPAAPYKLTEEETKLMMRLHHSFAVSEKLHRHIKTLLGHGGMFAIYNSNLLFHASVPLNSDGTLKEVTLYNGEKYSGKELMYQIEMTIRSAFNSDTAPAERTYAIDYFLYLWCGKDSPLFDKSKMATFERYFLKDKTTYKEEKGYYFRLRDNEAICDSILDAFGVTGDNRHIINGHVPVHASNGENPIKARGKLMVIDGGFSEAYHNETGIAGYTLVYHSRGFQLVQHEPFTSAADAIKRGTDIKSTTQIVEMSAHRMLVADTDCGNELKAQIVDLKKLLYAYRHGIIKERRR